MEELNINKICCREENAANIKKILQDFELNKNDLLFKKGIYIYGDPGTGKTTFVTKLLKEMNSSSSHHQPSEKLRMAIELSHRLKTQN